MNRAVHWIKRFIHVQTSQSDNANKNRARKLKKYFNLDFCICVIYSGLTNTKVKINSTSKENSLSFEGEYNKNTLLAKL